MNLQQRIDDFLEEMANADDFDERQSLLTDFIEMELMDQRQMCANAIPESSLVKYHCCLSVARESCINAVEQK